MKKYMFILFALLLAVLLTLGGCGKRNQPVTDQQETSSVSNSDPRNETEPKNGVGSEDAVPDSGVETGTPGSENRTGGDNANASGHTGSDTGRTTGADTDPGKTDVPNGSDHTSDGRQGSADGQQGGTTTSGNSGDQRDPGSESGGNGRSSDPGDPIAPDRGDEVTTANDKDPDTSKNKNPDTTGNKDTGTSKNKDPDTTGDKDPGTSENDTRQPDQTTKQDPTPVLLTWEAYYALSAREKDDYYYSFKSPKEFHEWADQAQEQFKIDHPDIEIGPDGIIDLNKLISGNDN